MMDGALSFLCDAMDPEAATLRDSFRFLIIPMLNPDGVILGNYRCSLAGCDLNRRWKTPSSHLHPTIKAAKSAILRAAHQLHMFLDFHGHSTATDAFIYGCHAPPLQTRLFPYVLSQVCPYFSFAKSRFG